MLKKVLAVLILLCCFCFGVSAESATLFTVNTAQKDETVTINVTTNKQTSVAGMDLILNYDSEYLTLKKETLKCSLDDCIIAIIEQGLFASLIFLDCSVVIKVILREIGENSNVKV